MFLKVCSSLYPLKLNILLQLASACHLINLEQEKTLNMAREFEMRLNCYSILYVKSQPGKKEVSCKFLTGRQCRKKLQEMGRNLQDGSLQPKDVFNQCSRRREAFLTLPTIRERFLLRPPKWSGSRTW